MLKKLVSVIKIFKLVKLIAFLIGLHLESDHKVHERNNNKPKNDSHCTYIFKVRKDGMYICV